MFQEILESIAAELDRRGISYMVIGGQAVLLYGVPRLTQDIDIILDLTPEKTEDVLQAVEVLGWQVLVENPCDFVRKTWVLPCQTSGDGIRVDLVFSFSPYERQAMERTRKVDIGNVSVKYAALEDVIIHKMIAGRPRDLEDVRLMLEKNPDADFQYLILWLSEFERELGVPYLEELDKRKPQEK